MYDILRQKIKGLKEVVRINGFGILLTILLMMLAFLIGFLFVQFFGFMGNEEDIGYSNYISVISALATTIIGVITIIIGYNTYIVNLKVVMQQNSSRIYLDEYVKVYFTEKEEVFVSIEFDTKKMYENNFPDEVKIRNVALGIEYSEEENNILCRSSELKGNGLSRESYGFIISNKNIRIELFEFMMHAGSSQNRDEYGVIFSLDIDCIFNSIVTKNQINIFTTFDRIIHEEGMRFKIDKTIYNVIRK